MISIPHAVLLLRQLPICDDLIRSIVEDFYRPHYIKKKSTDIIKILQEDRFYMDEDPNIRAKECIQQYNFGFADFYVDSSDEEDEDENTDKRDIIERTLIDDGWKFKNYEIPTPKIYNFVEGFDYDVKMNTSLISVYFYPQYELKLFVGTKFFKNLFPLWTLEDEDKEKIIPDWKKLKCPYGESRSIVREVGKTPKYLKNKYAMMNMIDEDIRNLDFCVWIQDDITCKWKYYEGNNITHEIKGEDTDYSMLNGKGRKIQITLMPELFNSKNGFHIVFKDY